MSPLSPCMPNHNISNYLWFIFCICDENSHLHSYTVKAKVVWFAVVIPLDQETLFLCHFLSYQSASSLSSESRGSLLWDLCSLFSATDKKEICFAPLNMTGSCFLQPLAVTLTHQRRFNKSEVTQKHKQTHVYDKGDSFVPQLEPLQQYEETSIVNSRQNLSYRTYTRALRAVWETQQKKNMTMHDCTSTNKYPYMRTLFLSLS